MSMENKINCHQIALTDNITGDPVLIYQQGFFYAKLPINATAITVYSRP